MINYEILARGSHAMRYATHDLVFGWLGKRERVVCPPSADSLYLQANNTL